MTSKSEMALLNACAGHPLALQRLRQMQAVVEAAVAAYSEELDFITYSERVHELHDALCAGGWIKPGE